MGTKYYELILSGRQLALLAAGAVSLMAVAFLLGVGVGLQEPARGEPATARYVAPEAAVAPVTVSSRPAQAPLPAEHVEVVPPLSSSPGPAAALVEPPATAMTSAAATPTAEPIPTATAVPLPREVQREPEPSHWVQVAALSRQDLADGVRQRIVALGFRPDQVVVRPAAGSYRVRLGPFLDEASARRVVSRLRAQGFADAFPVTE